MFVAYIVGWVVLNQTKFGAHVYALGGNPAAALNGIYVVTLLLFIRFIFIAPYFFSSRNLVNILISASLAGIVTAGYTVAILAGQIETSTQGVLAAATVTTALLSVRALTPVMFAASWVGARSAGLGLPLAVNRLARSSFRERAIEIGVLRAIGFTRREVIAFLGWELLVILPLWPRRRHVHRHLGKPRLHSLSASGNRTRGPAAAPGAADCLAKGLSGLSRPRSAVFWLNFRC